MKSEELCILAVGALFDSGARLNFRMGLDSVIPAKHVDPGVLTRDLETDHFLEFFDS